jgi:hypothetical protein
VLTLTAIHALSDAPATYYTVDTRWTAAPNWPARSPFTVAGNGQHPMTYRSVDRAGNVEAVRTGRANIGSLFAQTIGPAPDTQSHWRNASIDMGRPGTTAPHAASVLRNHYDVLLKCKIVDARPCVSRASLKIVARSSCGMEKWQHDTPTPGRTCCSPSGPLQAARSRPGRQHAGQGGLHG